ncbi:MAG: sarcosine oxidase subunit gamma [Paracoccaceae bacterium]
MGPGQAFLIGPEAQKLKGAALSDQTDGWSRMQVKGENSVAVLARLVPVDLRDATFKRSHTARTKLFHVGLSITRTGENQFELLVFRSMAKTVVDELSVAMKSVAALNFGNGSGG